MAAVAPCSRLHIMLQTAVQTVRWTYSLFWQLCPQQGMLEWRDGYYNGAIKTRKTVQAMEVSAEEATLQRSKQLRELYDSLQAGEANGQLGPTRRPTAALSPEDLTESEWFYLMCISFSFPPGSGLPGKAFAKQQYVWLTGASETDSKVFSRAILAKSARIQTVVCIPLLDGVVEIGTTKKVDEDVDLVQTIKSFFVGHQPCLPPKPALSEHSTSNPTTSPRFQSSAFPSTNNQIFDHHEEEDDEEDEEEEEEEEEDEKAELGSAGEASELMQFDMSSEDIRVGSSLDNASNNLGSDFHLLAASHTAATAKPKHRWGDSQYPKHDSLQAPPPSEISPELEELIEEDDSHYCQTVSAILQRHSSTTAAIVCSPDSAFTRWSNTSSTTIRRHPYIDRQAAAASASQWLLKYILFTVPLLGANSSNKAERRRCDKLLNERFITLRSLVPFVATRMDEVSILDDAIEYVKQLRKKMEDLETRMHQMEAADLLQKKYAKEQRRSGAVMEKRKMRIIEGDGGGGGGGGGKPTAVVCGDDQVHEAYGVQVEVSIIENDALVQLHCRHREGVLLDVMQTLRELRVETTAVQSSLHNGHFVAELRAKVQENVNGKRTSITEVKRAIHEIIPRYRT